MQNSLNHDANLNQSYDFDIDPPEEAGNALENNEDKVNIEEQKIKENSEAKNSNKNEDIKIIENEFPQTFIKESSKSKDNSFNLKDAQNDNRTQEIEHSNIETGEINIEHFNKRPGTHHQK